MSLVENIQIQKVNIGAEVYKSALDVRGWGEGEAGFNAAMQEVSAAGGGTLVVREDITFTSIPIQHLPKVTVIWEAKAIVKQGLSADYAYIMDGGADTPAYDNTDHFTLASKTNCYNLQLQAEDMFAGVDATGVLVTRCYGFTFQGGSIVGFLRGAYADTLCYEGRVSDFTAVVSSARTDTSVGVLGGITDSWYYNIAPVGYATGSKWLRSANSVQKIHAWGNTSTNQVGQLGKTHILIEITENAGFSTYRDIICDTPVRRNLNNVPSRTNGGVGVILDAWDCSLDGILVLPSRADTTPTAKQTLPMICSAQRCSVRDFMVSAAQFATDIWVSFEGTSGYLKNWFSGTGYAEAMRTGMTIGPNSGVQVQASTGYAVTNSTRASGIRDGNLQFSVTAVVVCSSVTNADFTLAVSSIYGLTAARSGKVVGARDAFFAATTNAGQQLYDITPVVVNPNEIKFMLEFANGAQRYARWSDVLASTGSKSITLSGTISTY